MDDSWYWRREKMGNYSVKNAYLLLQESAADSGLSSSSGFWRNVWNLKYCLRLKTSFWRAGTECLPTKDRLLSRKFLVNELCQMCNVANESVLHVLISCSQAEANWDLLEMTQVTGPINSFVAWLQLVFQQRQNEDILISVMLCWMLWINRNDLVWNQKCLDPSEVVNSTYAVLKQWKAFLDRSFDPCLGFLSQYDGAEQWCPPPVNSFKVNSDATIFEDLNCYSFAYVIRDHAGNIIEAHSSCMKGVQSPDVAEAMGIREALKWVKEIGHHNVIVESDCL